MTSSLTDPIAGVWIVPLCWIAVGAGRTVCRLVCPAIESDKISAAERSATALGVGFTAMALGVLALGLLGLLTPVWTATWCAVLAVVGGRSHGAMLAELRDGLRTAAAKPAMAAAAVAIGMGALVGCFAPPGSVEWDSLSYHLADPKIYVAAHRIAYLPWESHSNFAFDMEMLYSIGMLARSIALAKLFEFAIGAAGVVAVYRIAWRIEPRTATLAALIYSTIPIVFWEAGTAYVDLAAASYAALALVCLIAMQQTGERRFAWIAGILLGGMLGIKATAAITIALYAVGLLAVGRSTKESLGRRLATGAGMCGISALVGCAWYIKSALNTGNPVYPFAYSIFGGRYWNRVDAAAYSAAQRNFGMGHGLDALILAPYNVTMYLLPGHIAPSSYTQPFNDFQFAMASLSPLFLICAVAAPAVPLRPPRAIAALTAYSVASVAVWFVLTQQVRYLMPILPVLSVLAAWCVVHLAERAKVARLAAWSAAGVSLVFNIGLDANQALQSAQLAFHPAAQQRYLAASVAAYPAMEYINAYTPPSAKIVTYGEPRTLYLDRAYMWGDLGVDPEYPPYAKLGTPQALRTWFVDRGYDYILVNSAGARLSASKGWVGMVYALTFGSGRPPVYADPERGIVVYALS